MIFPARQRDQQPADPSTPPEGAAESVADPGLSVGDGHIDDLSASEEHSEELVVD